jgi:hypothetical protein
MRERESEMETENSKGELKEGEEERTNERTIIKKED